MTKFTLLAILWFSSTVFSKQTFQQAQDLLLAELSTTQELADKEALEWKTKFYQSLMDDQDPNIKILGYYEVLSGERKLDENFDVIDISSEINSMLELESLDHKSIATIFELCSYEKLKSYCNHKALFNRLDQSMPENAYVHLNYLSQVYETSNPTEIKQAIDDMAQSNYMDDFMYSHAGFRTKLENYVTDNPYPKNKLALEQLYVTRHSDSKTHQIAEISKNMQKIMTFLIIINNKISQPIPHYRSLIESCKTYTDIEISCLKTADLLIYKSKSFMSTVIGYAIKEEIFNQQGDIEKHELIESKKTNYKKQYECYSKIMHHGKTEMTHIGANFLKIAEPIEREMGEMAFFEKLAQLNYDYYSKLGDDQIKNPKTCQQAIN